MQRTSLADEAARDRATADVDGARPAAAVDELAVVASWFATHDVVLIAHFVVMGLLVAAAPAEPNAAAAGRRIGWVLAGLLVACWVGRAARLPWRVGAAVYRVGVVGAVAGSYLLLRSTLPVVQPGSHDAALSALDVAIFGVEPTLWLEPLMRRGVVEYFAFFYFSYFAIGLLYVLLAVGPLASRETSAEFGVGTAVVFGVGQLGYVLVPGFGPTGHLAARYQAPLDGGFFWQCVLDTVQAGGAMKDIFPSLHTAVPTWFALFALGRARRTGARAWGVLAAVTGFFAANIIVSTVVLRWHYVVDLAAGLSLALSAAWLAPRVARWERRLRAAHGLPHAWDLGGRPRP